MTTGVIQGAESGSFLRRIEELLQGEDDFYESVATDLGLDPSIVTSAHPASASAPPLPEAAAPAPGVTKPDTALLQAVQAATSLLKAYRTHGHLAARLDPLGSEPKGDPAIQPENLGLTPEVMSQIPAEILRIGVEGETLLEALPRMREAYCGTIGYQIEHLSSHQQRMWLRDMIETGWHRKPLEPDEKQQLLDRLIQVFGFERYLEKAYLGQKMFSLEGLDTVVPMLDEVFEMAHTEGARDVVIGMAHRGRLSVLAHNIGRPVEAILAEFEGAKAIEAVKSLAAIPTGGTGDVKYHYGHGGSYETRDGAEIGVRLYPNPSHLEYVDPVVTGAARAAQSSRRDGHLEHDPMVAVPVLLHGDAAFPAQGCRGDPQPPVARGLLDRRHRPHHPEQPDRLHDRSGGGPFDSVRRRHGEGLQRPDHPRERRRPGGVRGRRPARDGLPGALGPRRSDRPDRIPPLRSQRDRRAGLHAAVDGGEDQGAPAGQPALRRGRSSRRASSPRTRSRSETRSAGEV